MLLSSVVEPTLNLGEALGSNPNTRNKQIATAKPTNTSMGNPKTGTVAPSWKTGHPHTTASTNGLLKNYIQAHGGHTHTHTHTHTQFSLINTSHAPDD